MNNSQLFDFPPLDMGPLHYFSVLGRALFIAQHFEMNCRAIAGFLYMREESIMHGSSVLEDPAFRNHIGKLWRTPLGWNVKDLSKLRILSDDAAPIFKAAVDARNEIAHNVAMGISETLDSELDERIDRILGSVRSIAEADKIATAMIHMLNKDPLPTAEFFASYEDRVTAWVSADTFEE
jgi:hypothetical protein